MTIKEREGVLRIKRFDRLWGPFGVGLTFKPYTIGMGASLPYWPCIEGITLVAHLPFLRAYICWARRPERSYR